MKVVHHEVAVLVGKAVLTALQEETPGGFVLIITWSAFMALPYFPDSKRWHLVVDEIPQVATSVEVLAPESHVHLTEQLELVGQGPIWSLVSTRSGGSLRKLAETADAALKNTLQPMARQLQSPFWNTYTRTSTYTDLVSGRGKRLSLHFVLRPEIFKGFNRVTILGANFEHSLLYHVWHHQGVVFEEDQDLKLDLRFTEHKNGDTVTILYGIDVDWSKSLRDRNEGEVWKRLIKAIRSHFKDMKFGWIANKDKAAENPFADLDAECLPQVSHGLNAFQHLDNIVFLSARLPSPEHISFLGWLGAADDRVRRAVYFEALYQTVLRGSIRNPDNRNQKLVFVPDRAAAEFLRNLLPGSRMEKLPIDWLGVTFTGTLGRRRMHESGTGRVQHHRAQKQAEVNRIIAKMNTDRATMTNEEVAEHHRLLISVIPTKPTRLWESCNENPIKEGNHSSVTQNVFGTIFDTLYATLPNCLVDDTDLESFIKALRDLNRTNFERKECCLLISPSVFDPSLSSETYRGLANVLYANGIWLDFEKGNLSHKDFASIFPQLRVVAFNSFSSTKKQPRFRIMIPTTRTVTKEEYKLLTTQILQAIKDEGYRYPKVNPEKPYLKAHGIDMGKLHAASLFYLPCQPVDPKGRIWKDHRDNGRAALDVDDWLENAITIESDEPLPVQPREEGVYNKARVDRALDRWNWLGTQKGNGDSELFILYRELKAAGVPAYEAHSLLLGAAGNASSPIERRNQAQRLLKSW